MRARDLIETLKLSYKIRRPVCVLGPPGIGKSSIFQQVSTKENLQLLDIRLIYFDPVDLRGLPYLDGRTTRWLQPSFLPTEGNGIFLFDEFNSAPPSIQGIFYQLCHDRKIAEYILPEGWLVCAAGNRQSDKALSNRMPSALVSRFTMVELEVNFEDWINYALIHNFSTEIISFIKFRANLLMDFDSKTWKQDTAFACPRTWEYLDQYLKINKNLNQEMIAGIVGVGAASEFMVFKKIFEVLPNLDSIINDPEKAKVPKEPSLLYAVTVGLAKRISINNVENIFKYFSRLTKEFEVCGVFDSATVSPEIMISDTFKKWSNQNERFLNCM